MGIDQKKPKQQKVTRKGNGDEFVMENYDFVQIILATGQQGY